MDLKLISVSCLNSCGRHSFDLSIHEHFCYGTSSGAEGWEGVLFLFIFSPSAAFMLTVNLSGSRCPVALSKAKA